MGGCPAWWVASRGSKKRFEYIENSVTHMLSSLPALKRTSNQPQGWSGSRDLVWLIHHPLEKHMDAEPKSDPSDFSRRFMVRWRARSDLDNVWLGALRRIYNLTDDHT